MNCLSGHLLKVVILSIIFSNLLANDRLYAQSRYSISGFISDDSNGEILIGVNLFVPELKIGTSTNEYGFYSLFVPESDSVELSIRFLGYQPLLLKIKIIQDLKLNLRLNPVETNLEAVIVKAENHRDNIDRPTMGTIELSTAKIKELPVILGEQDVLKVIQLLPGIKAGNEGTTGFFVRGGNADQNLIQLDEAVVYNPNHLFGLFSTFNANAINNVQLIKGGFPAQYGGRLSSILNINMREGNKRQLGVQGGIGMISSQLTVEGPIVRDKASFIISGRRTYFDWLIKPFLPKSVSTDYRFYDLNAKTNWNISSKDRIYLSFFKGSDDAFYSQDGVQYNILLGNQTGTLRWNHIYGSNLFVNTSLIFNRYEQNVAALQDNSFSKVFSGINDINLKTGLQYKPADSHELRAGLQVMHHQFKSLGDTRAQSPKIINPEVSKDSIPTKFFEEVALYLNDEITFDDYFSASLGMRAAAFIDKESNYIRLEPRLGFKVKINSSSSLKLSYSLMNQFLHLVPSSTAAVPTDIWIPSTRFTKPQQSQQAAIGYFKNFRDNSIETSIEAYYKKMNHQVLFKEGNQLIKSLDADQFLTYGKGWSYGLEMFFNKKAGRLSGWIGYSLSWTFQKFPQLNFGKKFPFRYDRRHDLSLVGSYSISEKWSFSGTFVLSSGNTYTLPTGRIAVVGGGSIFEGNYFIYNSRNNARLNPFHRLNLSISRKNKHRLFRRSAASEWILSLYNVYSRQNPYFLYFDIDPLTDQPRAKQISLLPLIPSIAYSFKI
ncbi:MAG: TonB-dependent receptor [Saprospiraceae bacterium]|nr:TonB-dependent receptor [Saprospiraceae bacterium]